MMKSRMLPCKECGRLVTIRSKGKCSACRSKELPRKERKPINIRKNVKDAKKSEFFEKHIKYINTFGIRSTESDNMLIPASSCNVCHVLPKRIYKSVQYEDAWVVYLTADEHTRFDYLLDTHQFEKLAQEFPNTLAYIKLLPFDMVEENGKLLTAIKTFLGYE